MKEVLKNLNNLLFENDTVVVAVSAGPDSMALFDALIELKEQKNINIICAHVNHNTGRIGQKEEEEYVREYCKKNNVIFELLTIDNYSNGNFEEEARTKRYEFFEQLIKKYNAKYLFTAHHGDDLIETILMRIVRGSTLKGYSGFSKIVEKENYKIVRPLIETTKEEIIDYLNSKNIKYFIDNTNLEDDHTRNRYRKYLLPKLKEEDKNVHLKFNKFSRLLLEYDKYITNESKKCLEEVYQNNKLDISKFNELDYVIKLNIIYDILEKKYNADLVNINDNFINLIFDLIKSDKKNTFIDLPGNIKLIKKYNVLEFSVDNNNTIDYCIELCNENILPNSDKIEIIDNTDSDSNYICRINNADVKLPLYIRNRKEGDKISVKGLNGSKKVKDIFINSKIIKKERDEWPLLVDSNNNVIWIPGIKKSKIDKTKEEKYDIILKYYKGGNHE